MFDNKIPARSFHSGHVCHHHADITRIHRFPAFSCTPLKDTMHATLTYSTAIIPGHHIDDASWRLRDALSDSMFVPSDTDDAETILRTLGFFTETTLMGDVAIVGYEWDYADTALVMAALAPCMEDSVMSWSSADGHSWELRFEGGTMTRRTIVTN